MITNFPLKDGFCRGVNTVTLAVTFSIDRSFYRQRYNVEQTLTAFAALARQETDLQELSEKLVRVVEETMQPESVSFCLSKRPI